MSLHARHAHSSASSKASASNVGSIIEDAPFQRDPHRPPAAPRATRTPNARPRHELTPDGDVRLVLPTGTLLTDSEARRLAWGILADLDPDEAAGAPARPAYRAARLREVLRAVEATPGLSAAELAARFPWTLRQTQRRLQVLTDSGRVVRHGDRSEGFRYLPAEAG